MATAELPQPHAARRPFRALEASREDTIARWNPSAEHEVAGDDLDDLLIGGDDGDPSPRASVTLIGSNGSLIRGGTLIGDSGLRAPLEPAPPAGSGGAPDRTASAGKRMGDDGGLELADELLRDLAADHERLVDIARALGACPACWGERIGCPRCGGVGRPGRENPEPEAFDRYVRPLLNRLDPDGILRVRVRPTGSEAHPAGRGPAYWVDDD